MSEDEWNTGSGNTGRPKIGSSDLRFWNIQDVTGHRYLAYLSDSGQGRWQLPLPRHDFEKLWAALCTANPEIQEAYGSPQNFIRQYVGKLMAHLLDEADWDDPSVTPMLIQREIAVEQERETQVHEMWEAVKSPVVPMRLREKACKWLLEQEQGMIETYLGLTHDDLVVAWTDLTGD